MKLYYSHSDREVYPMGHTPQVLFNQLYNSSITIDLHTVYSIRLLEFMQETMEHPMVLFKYPGTLSSDVTEIRDRRPNTVFFTSIHNFCKGIEAPHINPNGEQVLITCIRAMSDTIGVDIVYLDPAITTGILRKHFIDQVMETL